MECFCNPKDIFCTLCTKPLLHVCFNVLHTQQICVVWEHSTQRWLKSFVAIRLKKRKETFPFSRPPCTSMDKHLLVFSGKLSMFLCPRFQKITESQGGIPHLLRTTLMQCKVCRYGPHISCERYPVKSLVVQTLECRS